jgi:hypothetical protein
MLDAPRAHGPAKPMSDARLVRQPPMTDAANKCPEVDPWGPIATCCTRVTCRRKPDVARAQYVVIGALARAPTRSGVVSTSPHSRMSTACAVTGALARVGAEVQPMDLTREPWPHHSLREPEGPARAFEPEEDDGIEPTTSALQGRRQLDSEKHRPERIWGKKPLAQRPFALQSLYPCALLLPSVDRWAEAGFGGALLRVPSP